MHNALLPSDLSTPLVARGREAKVSATVASPGLRNDEWLAGKVREAEALLKSAPHSHDLRNDHFSLIFLSELHRRGIAVDLSQAEVCLTRMRATLAAKMPANL